MDQRTPELVRREFGSKVGAFLHSQKMSAKTNAFCLDFPS